MPQRSRPYTANIEDFEVVSDDSQWEPAIEPARQISPAMAERNDWSDRTTPEKIRRVLEWGGNAIAGMTGMGSAGGEAVENPGTTLATAAVPLAVKGVASAIPTRAKAGQKFQEVMGAVGDKPVDVSRPGDAALRIAELADRGGMMPKVVRDLLRRATDPTKPEPNYREMRDFYSNISRLSADEMKRLPPVVKKELGGLRESLKEALAKTAASGGKERVFRSAMRQYAVAARMRELSAKVGQTAVQHGGKGAAAVVGAGAAYKALSGLFD